MNQLLFVTDPLCSWCWGTLPEVFKVKEQLPDSVQFNLIMGGLQIGPDDGLVEYDVKRLRRLWQEVANTTGQTFSGKIPKDFRYHSELACRSVEIARRQNNGDPPFDYFERLQRAFYIEGWDINQIDVLAHLLDATAETVEIDIYSTEIIQQTRQNFALARSLSANALPVFLLDTGDGFKLVCGGYVTAEYLLPDIQARLDMLIN